MLRRPSTNQASLRPAVREAGPTKTSRFPLHPFPASAGIWFLLIVAATFLAYYPAWHAGFIWNDSDYVTAPELRSWHGLGRIWFEIGATQQYYPLLHTSFWIQHRLWGDLPIGYHLVNLALHATAACLFTQILRQLWRPQVADGAQGAEMAPAAARRASRRDASDGRPSGQSEAQTVRFSSADQAALLAGLIFALHPVCVESVAWITEQKNTLSTVFYLLAALVYLRFDETRTPGSYALGLVLFAAAVLSKSVAATLPGALLVVIWWREGRLSLKRDFLPLAPWFAVGAAAGLFTAWVERTYIGAQGAAFALTPLDRCLLAGRVIWFYLGKLLWPVDLIFIYHRWHIDARTGWQYLFPLGVSVLLTGLAWSAFRRRSRLARSPLAAALLFIGGLFPLLGFLNVYAFKFSFVADHWQYLAMLAVITLLAGAWERWRQRFTARPDGRWAKVPEITAVAVVAALGILSWRECRNYRDPETFYRTILARNSECWMAHENLGRLMGEKGRFQEAIVLCEAALELNPALAEAELNLGAALAATGKGSDAIPHYEAALRLRPDYAQAQSNLGVVLARQGKYAAALELLTRASRLRPDSAEIHLNLGNISYLKGNFSEAIAHFQTALRLQPDYATARQNLMLAQSASKSQGGGN